MFFGCFKLKNRVLSMSDIEPIFSKPTEKLSFDISEEFKSYLESIPAIKEFSEILNNFLLKYFKTYPIKPKKVQFLFFKFPGEDYKEPMLKVIFPDRGEIDILKIKDQIEENLKLELANLATDLEEFKNYRKIQNRFRIVIRRG